MNNAKVIENYNEFNEEGFLDVMPFLEKRMAEIKELLEATSGLQRNEFYRKYKTLELASRSTHYQKQWRQERDPIQMYRIQGKLEELDRFIDLERQRDLLQNELNNLKIQIEKGRETKK